MDAIQKQARKIRQQIRKSAAKQGISVDEYRRIHNITPDVIRQMAADQPVVYRDSTDSDSATTGYKPYDGVSNRPKYEALRFGKPFIMMSSSDISGTEFVMRLASNGHYLPIHKFARGIGRTQAYKLNS